MSLNPVLQVDITRNYGGLVNEFAIMYRSVIWSLKSQGLWQIRDARYNHNRLREYIALETLPLESVPKHPIWIDENKDICVIDQRRLPWELVYARLCSADDAIFAITDMVVRGAPLVGVTGACGLYLALRDLSDPMDDEAIKREAKKIGSARPTAVNLSWAVGRVLSEVLKMEDPGSRVSAALETAQAIAAREAQSSRSIGDWGLGLIEAAAKRNPGKPVNILTHCNAGWLACIEYGTATAPIYRAHEEGIDVHVWVDETRPANQGSRLTAWELLQKGVPHTVIADNTGGYLMQHKMVDLVIVGTDRVTAQGDVANKIGTYLKALAAFDNGIPFFVALPCSTFDLSIKDGLKEIPIEQRDPDEVRYIPCAKKSREALLVPEGSGAVNFAFDVTPARLVTALITDRGICHPDYDSIKRLLGE